MDDMTRSKTKFEQSIDRRVKEAISQEEKSWYKDEELEEIPKLKLVIVFEGIDSKMNVVEDRHEFEWRPKPSIASKWIDLEKQIVMADIASNDDVLVKALPEIPWNYSGNALEELGLLEFEKELVTRAWIEVVPGSLNFIIVDKTVCIQPITFIWELNTTGCTSREERGLSNRFLLGTKKRFDHFKKTELRMSPDECLKLGKEARRDKLWEKIDNKANRYSGEISVSSKEFFKQTLANAFMEDAPAISACQDARALEMYTEDLSF